MVSPLLIFLDDVQWVDSGSVAALRVLAPRLASLPIGWVLAMRPDQGPAHVRSAVEYLAAEGAERLVLEPLQQAAVAQLASDAMQAEPDETLLRMAGEVGGNPFLLVELLEGLRQEELVTARSRTQAPSCRPPTRPASSSPRSAPAAMQPAATSPRGRARLFSALLALIVFGIVTIFVSVPHGDVIY
jgi:hypothetical protein